MKHAKIKDGIVENTILADAEFIATMPGEWVDFSHTECGIGWSYDGLDFHPPELPAPAPVPRHISVGAFYDRFGAAKWGILADTTPGVVAVIRDASVRAYIDLDNPQLPGGLQIIEAAGHTIDKSAILTAPVMESEKP